MVKTKKDEDINRSYEETQKKFVVDLFRTSLQNTKHLHRQIKSFACIERLGKKEEG